MRLVGVERGATGRDRASEVPAMGCGNVAVSLSLPQQNRDPDRCEIESPRARHERQVPHWASRSLPTGLLKARHEAVADFGLLQEGSIWLRKCGGHPFAAACPTAAHRPEVEPEQKAQNRRCKTGEPNHRPKGPAHRRKDAWAIQGGHAAEQSDDPNPVGNPNATGSGVRCAAR